MKMSHAAKNQLYPSTIKIPDGIEQRISSFTINDRSKTQGLFFNRKGHLLQSQKKETRKHKIKSQKMEQKGRVIKFTTIDTRALEGKSLRSNPFSPSIVWIYLLTLPDPLFDELDLAP